MEVDDDADGKKKETKQSASDQSSVYEGGTTRRILALTQRHHSQEDARCHEQDEGMLHQVGVSPRQRGQVGVVLLQLLHPDLPGLEHGGQATEGTARLGGWNAVDGGRTQGETHCRLNTALGET